MGWVRVAVLPSFAASLPPSFFFPLSFIILLRILSFWTIPGSCTDNGFMIAIVSLPAPSRAKLALAG